MRQLVIASLVAMACSGRGSSVAERFPGPGEPGEEAADVEARGASGPIDTSPPIDAGPPIDEAVARALLAERFRAAGLRVRYDVRLVSPGDGASGFDVTVDGFDPERGIGFEYIDASERGLDLDGAEQAALARDPTRRVLVIEAADEATVRSRAAAFLERLPASP